MKKNWLSLLIALTFLAFLISFGVVYYQFSEGWSSIDSFYFTVMTITSVGYGDLVPTHDVSKLVTAFYSLVSIPVVILAVSVIAKSYFEERISKVEKRMSELIRREKIIEEEVEGLADRKVIPARRGFWASLLNLK